uniref:Secreted protein n=1 Tax=Triticum urartu TaxID=4572 RepID=A0A8R7QR72_TRIUA
MFFFLLHVIWFNCVAQWWWRSLCRLLPVLVPWHSPPPLQTIHHRLTSPFNNGEGVHAAGGRGVALGSSIVRAPS